MSAAGAEGGAAREAILGRIREALGPDEHPPAAAPPPRYRRRSELDREEMLALFAERCRDYGAIVTTVAASDVGEAVAHALVQRGAELVAVPTDLPAAWRVAPVEWIEDGASPGSVTRLDAADGALTGCAVAIAETGTIVLDGGARQGRRALTLVPDYHLCVVDAAQLVGLVPEALERLQPSAAAGSPITFVSGCSATSDIELERVGGVHGPRTLELLLAL